MAIVGLYAEVYWGAADPVAWTLAQLAPTFWLDATASSTLTLSGSTITAASDAAGGPLVLGQVGGAATPVLQAGALNGLPAVRTSLVGGEKLWVGQGAGIGAPPPMGSDVAATVMAVAQIYASAGSTYPVVASMGDNAEASNEAMFLGARLSSWAAYAQTGSIGAVGGTTDGSPHILSLEYDGATNFVARVDGVIVAGPTTAGAFAARGTGFPSGLGIQPSFSGFNGAVDVGQAAWFVGAELSNASRQRVERSWGDLYGLALPDLIVAIGDSLSWAAYDDTYTGSNPGNPLSGIGVDHASAYLYQLATQTAVPAFAGWSYTTFNDGRPALTAAQILAAMTSPTLFSPLRKNNVAIIYAGTNDAGTTGNPSFDPAATLATLVTIHDTCRSHGATAVLVCTLPPWIGQDAAKLATLNTGIRATFPYVCDLAADSRLSGGLSVSGGLWGGMYDDVYRDASGAAIGHLNVAGEEVAAEVIAAKALPLRLSIGGEPANDNGVAVAALVACVAVVQRRRRRAA
jgi:lysophospholipase L1-like esterase